jgi:hypothetical protein
MTDSGSRIDLGALAFDQGFFLLRSPKRRRRPFSADAETADPYRHVFTYTDSPAAMS